MATRIKAKPTVSSPAAFAKPLGVQQSKGIKAKPVYTNKGVKQEQRQGSIPVYTNKGVIRNDSGNRNLQINTNKSAMNQMNSKRRTEDEYDRVFGRTRNRKK